MHIACRAQPGLGRVYGGKRVYLEITPEGHMVQHSKAGSKWKPTLLGKPSSSKGRKAAAVGRRSSKSASAPGGAASRQKSARGSRRSLPDTGDQAAGAAAQPAQEACMKRLKETFQDAIAISIEPFLPAEKLTPLYGSEQDALLFGSRIAAKEGAFLAQGHIGGFIKTCPEGYFMIGFWEHGINSYAFYYVKSELNWKVFFRLPYGGVYMDNDVCCI